MYSIENEYYNIPLNHMLVHGQHSSFIIISLKILHRHTAFEDIYNMIDLVHNYGITRNNHYMHWCTLVRK